MTLTLTAWGEEGRSWPATVELRLRPRLELVGWSHAEKTRKRGRRRYEHLLEARLLQKEMACVQLDTRTKLYPELEEGELVADATDRLPLVALARRTDVEPKPGADDECVCKAVVLTRWELKGASASEYAVEADPGLSEEGVFAFFVRSRRPLLRSAHRASPELFLHLEASVAPSAPANVLREDLSLDLQLTPLCLFLKLWAVPGLRPGTSEATAFVCLPRNPHHCVSGISLRLDVEAGGAARLSPVGDEVRCTDDTGLASWVLRWQGLTWANHREAFFRVKCGPVDARGVVTEATEVPIDIGANVRELLADMHDKRERPPLELTNVHFPTHRSHPSFGYTWPDWWSGPVMNAANYTLFKLVSLVSEAAVRARRTMNYYACGALSGRVYTYCLKRRFWSPGRTIGDLGRMHGIECHRYSMGLEFMAMSHHWAGIYLSGSSPNDDPRFIDPWWRQAWELEAYKVPEGLLTQADELEYGAGIAASAAAVLLAGIALAGVFAGAAGIGLTAFVVTQILMPAMAAGTFGGTMGTDGQAGPTLLDDNGCYSVLGQRNVDWKVEALRALWEREPGNVDPWREWW